ncbi:MAG: hypothetical protein U1C57_00080 [Candidatus Doudnabacteria bacterium]|nr:hypothetical protein [Candidatus Doudnabacteria bacterium]
MIFISAAVAVTTVSTDVVTGGNLQASSTLLVTGDVLTYGNSTFGNAATDINLFTGTLQATTTALFTAGITTYGNSIFGDTNADTNTFAGNITLENSETLGNATNNNIFLGANTISLATTTATTTGSVWVSAKGGITTTTLQVNGNIEGNAGGATRGSCLQLWQEDVIYRIYVVEANALMVEAGTCQ